ncbi:sensor histidine kinase [Geothrix sp. 21YS21S-2]|uniref:sensor histidine kinase n=1 Tax=Geothrix sp. 21YS21S-2 TaxID=3068893 RepID=UPI0027B9887F|nr:HAMP domain-containing sensor histidine kinase [Geothrix sp. 21YS21S-2]
MHSALVLFFNIATIALALAKARDLPEERTGWRIFALGVAVSMLGNALWLVLPIAPGAAAPMRAVAYAATPLSAAILALAVWSWPWRGRDSHRGLNLLGSLVFCLSFLLLPWIRGVWSPVMEGAPPLRIFVITLCSRLVLAGGLASFLVAGDPRRLRGPLGWLLLNCSLLFVQGAFLSHSMARMDVAARSPWFALTPLITGALFLAAYTRHAAEVPTEEARLGNHLPGLLLHVPFLATSTLIVVAIIEGRPPGPGVLLVFLLMTASLVLRQFLLQEQLMASHREMEERVRSRTVELERMQDVVLLNERLNAVVVLGAGLVHDLNKGLGSILSAAEVLQMELERRMKVSGFAVEAIIQAVERSAVLSSRVMDFSRRLQEEGEVRDLRRELGALEGLLKLLVPCGVHLVMQPGQEPAPVRIHTEDLKQILLNLVANARDAMPGGGTIRVAVGKETLTGETYLDVEDTGTGIPEETRARMFEPFFTTKDPGTATGLGLASVKVLLERVQGRVEVSSSMGAGTRFRLLFPAAASVHA